MEKKETPQERYARKYKKDYVIHCFKSTEMDIISRMDVQENKAGYIKRLIREDIKRENEGKNG